MVGRRFVAILLCLLPGVILTVSTHALPWRMRVCDRGLSKLPSCTITSGN